MTQILLSGLLFGMLFGFFLQRGHILRFEKQVNLLRFKDMTVLKYMLSATLVGMIGLQLLEQTLHLDLPSKPAFMFAIIVGGLTFGLGWAIVGYCPGTLFGAMGEGRTDAVWAFLGSAVSAVTYIWIHPFSQININPVLAYRSLDLDLMLHVNPWFVIGVFGVICVALFWWLERRGL